MSFTCMDRKGFFRNVMNRETARFGLTLMCGSKEKSIFDSVLSIEPMNLSDKGR